MEMIIDEALTLVKKKMVEHGAFDRNAYKNLVEESVDYFIERGKLTDDDNLELIKDALMDAYEDVRDSFDGESSGEGGEEPDSEKSDDDGADEDDDEIEVLDDEDLEALDELDEELRGEEEEEADR